MVYKEDFISRMAKEHDFTKESTREFYDAFLETLGKYLIEEQDVMFYNFGAFRMRKYRYDKTDNRVTRPVFEISRDFVKRAEREKANEE